MAGLISEFSLGSGVSQDPTRSQYIELQGTPNTELPPGTYLAVVESNANILGGRIDAVFDLSGQVYGNNGFFVVAQFNHPFEVDPEANILVGDTAGFSGLPDGVYEGQNDTQFNVFTPTLFFFQSDVRPAVGDDIDVDFNGTIDPTGVASAWTIHDSVTVADIFDFYGYGRTAIGPGSQSRSLQSDSVLITLDEFAGRRTSYAARIGDPSASGPNSWVAGQTIEATDGTTRLTHNYVGYSANPTAFSGRELDHLGTYNFFGGVRGVVVNDDIGSPVPGITVLADTNGNGVRDLVTTVVEPDNYLPGTELTNVIAGMTITTGGSTSDLPNGTVTTTATSAGLASTGNRVFHHDFSGFDRFDKLRVDFYRPVDEVIIDAIGTSSFRTGTARLEAFNSNGESIAVSRSDVVSQAVRSQLLVAPQGGGIAYVLIYDEDNFGGYVNFDRLVVRQREAIATTNAEGEYYLGLMPPGTYDITIPQSANAILKSPVGGFEQITITGNEHFNVDFAFGENKPPVIDVDSLQMSVDENSPLNHVVGTVLANDPDTGQSLRYRLIGGSGRRTFALNPTTGEVRVNNPSALNFEETKEFDLVVEVSDSFVPRLTDQATITISVNNINEPPKFDLNRFTLSEDQADGSTFGPVVATDEDALNVLPDPPDDNDDPMLDDDGNPIDPPPLVHPNEVIGLDSGVFTYAIADDVYGDMFSIDPQSGLITLTPRSTWTDQRRLDFEAAKQITLRISATDQSIQPATSFANVVFDVTDVNEQPVLAPATLNVSETATQGVVIGTLSVDDPEDFQTHRFEITGGNESGKFSIDSASGQLSVATGAAFDFETTSSFDLTIQATENTTEALSSTANVRINVVNNDEPPVATVPSNIQIDENSPSGTLVATVSAIDPEGADVVISQRSGEANFTLDRQTGEIRVATNANLDFETLAEHSVLLRFADNSFPPKFTDVTLPIRLIDVNEAPSIESASLSVLENSNSGTELARVIASDVDSGDSLTYELVPGTNGEAAIFSIDSQTGAISLNEGAVLDFESQEVYSVNVRVTDSAQNSIEETVEVLVVDLNENPTIAQPFENLRIRPGRYFCFAFDDDRFFDPDEGTVFNVAVNSSNGQLPVWLQYDSESRQLRGTPQLSDQGSTSIIVQVTDSGEVPIPATDAFTLTVIDSDDGEFFVPTCVSQWQNQGNPLDVNNSGDVEPVDAVIILNYLNRFGSQIVPTGVDPPYFLDVDGDNVIRPIDALRVINGLTAPASNASMTQPESEPAEAIGVVASEADTQSSGHPSTGAANPPIAPFAVDHVMAEDDDDDDDESELTSSLSLLDDDLP
ncbi:MAG: cadherin domain-containing protein [Pirellulaceae bacterium]